MATTDAHAGRVSGVPRRFRAIVVDDDADVRALVRRSLERSGRFTVVAEAEDGDQAVAAAALHQPQVTLLDLHMPGGDGLAALPLIRDAAPECTVVVLSALQGPNVEDDVLKAGASGFLAKQRSWGGLPGDLLRLLESVDVRPPRRQRSLALPAALTSGGSARKWLRTTLLQWGIGDLLDDVELMATELVNNAVVHAASAVTLHLRLHDNRLRVEVSDTGDGALHRLETTVDDTSGRGLFLVEALSDSWGTSASHDGKVVWFELEGV